MNGRVSSAQSATHLAHIGKTNTTLAPQLFDQRLIPQRTSLGVRRDDRTSYINPICSCINGQCQKHTRTTIQMLHTHTQSDKYMGLEVFRPQTSPRENVSLRSTNILSHANYPPSGTAATRWIFKHANIITLNQTAQLFGKHVILRGQASER